jgi:hypothetical protein
MPEILISTPYDCINVHSGSLQFDTKGNFFLDKKTEARVDLAVELYKKGQARLIIMNGGPGAITKTGGTEGVEEVVMPFLPPSTQLVHCHYMLARAREQGVPSTNIHVQPWSLDTVTEGFNTTVSLFTSLGIERDLYVSNQMHLPRVGIILRYMAPEIIHTGAPGVITAFDQHSQRAELEEKARQQLEKRFENITPGDIPAIEAHLRENYAHRFIIPTHERAGKYKPA